MLLLNGFVFLFCIIFDTIFGIRVILFRVFQQCMMQLNEMKIDTELFDP